MRPVRQVLTRTHPISRRKSIYLASHIGKIIGWPVPEARAFIRDLTEHATKRPFVYAHKWRPFDLVMWDNRCTMHRVRRYDATQVRDMRRTTVAGTEPTVAQESLAAE
jgi:alpha-ketoglutarate-dependent 2,4-dichlorophenoxyacetate dioxygenase